MLSDLRTGPCFTHGGGAEPVRDGLVSEYSLTWPGSRAGHHALDPLGDRADDKVPGGWSKRRGGIGGGGTREGDTPAVDRFRATPGAGAGSDGGQRVDEGRAVPASPWHHSTAEPGRLRSGCPTRAFGLAVLAACERSDRPWTSQTSPGATASTFQGTKISFAGLPTDRAQSSLAKLGPAPRRRVSKHPGSTYRKMLPRRNRDCTCPFDPSSLPAGFPSAYGLHRARHWLTEHLRDTTLPGVATPYLPGITVSSENSIVTAWRPGCGVST